MTLQDFNNLTKKYLEGRTTEEENKYLQEWQNSQSFLEESKLTAEEQEQSKSKMWGVIKEQVGYKKKATWLQISFYSGIAASILFVAAYLTILKSENAKT